MTQSNDLISRDAALASLHGLHNYCARAVILGLPAAPAMKARLLVYHLKDDRPCVHIPTGIYEAVDGSWHPLDTLTPPALTDAPAVKVKPLEWVSHPTNRHHSALSTTGLYLADLTGWRLAHEGHWHDADNMEAAKAAAQADYEARILAALEGGEA